VGADGSAEEATGAKRVVIADDEALLREGVAAIVSSAGYDVVAVAADAEELVRKVRGHKPDLVVTDVRMPPEQRDDGLRAAVELRREHPDLRVLVLSQYVEESYLLELMGEDASGVGYLLKQRVTDRAGFLDAMERVLAGGSAIDPEVVTAMMGRRVRNDPLEALTERQREVLALMAEGWSNKAIADKLVVSEQTVEKHIWSILSALDLPPAPESHRRVTAVLRFLDATGP
jgi:DNA-binding NarL/FixJ family response regulator